MEDKLQGKVTRFFEGRGFGFIQSDSGIDFFVHFRNIIASEGTYKSLIAGERVEFNIKANPKGEEAVNVRVLDA